MAKTCSPGARKHGHETHLVLVQQCRRCGRWVVLTGHVASVDQFDDPTEAIAEAHARHAALVGRPDPEPLLVTIGALGSGASAPPPVRRFGTAQPAVGSPAEQSLDGAA